MTMFFAAIRVHLRRRMNGGIPSVLFSLILFLGSISVSAEDALIWKIRHPERPGVLFLAGSVHLGHPDMYPLDRAYDEALGKSDYLVFEIASPNLMKAAAFTMKRGMYPARSEINLRTLLGEKDFASLCGMIRGVAPVSLARMRPWVVMPLMEIEEAKKLNFSAEGGLESVIHAAGAGRPERSLETDLGQLQMIADPAVEEEILAEIRRTLSSPETLRGEIGALVPAVREGETGLLLQSLERMRRDTPGVYRNLIASRNRGMAKRLFEMLKEEKTGFVLVGAGHCLGAESIQELLKREGCTSVRLKFAGAPGELKPKEKVARTVVQPARADGK